MIPVNRRRLLAAFGGSLITASRAFGQSAGEDIAQRLAHAEHDGKVNGLHTLLVSRDGQIVFEHYGASEDEVEGRPPVGTVFFAPDVPHDLRSVSKSIVGLAYGVALAAGKVPPPEAKLYAQFPEYADLAREDGRDRLTIHHVLSMTMGLDWDELMIPYGDLRNAENAMEAAPDRFRFVLERAIAGEPGAKWSYCGGATALLGGLIERGTGEELLPYCRRVLFDPLDFGLAEWAKGKDGKYRAASGARLLPRDLVKIGHLMLAGGRWNGNEVVPADWVKRLATPAIEIEPGFRYGYHWYLGASFAGSPPRWHRWIGGIGWGGQRLHVFPALDLTLMIHCGNYHRPRAEQTQIINAVIADVVLPSFA
jgi:CubicO group peptidase (beta-lactamase class C family)